MLAQGIHALGWGSCRLSPDLNNCTDFLQHALMHRHIDFPAPIIIPSTLCQDNALMLAQDSLLSSEIAACCLHT